ncbi:restriction endonuclease [Microbulbifer sp. JMSA004]|uniref:restriction endonuclease n=1 Tax=Microbulbifer sp. JMSA004 TaxID=3243370 RepID=UPI0040393A1C
MIFPNPEDLSPEEFELLVKEWFESCKGELSSFNATQRQIKSGYDGDYEIDVAISFEIFGGAKIDVIVECKKYKNPVGRDLIQILKDKKNSTGSHKAILITTSTFQSGAIEYAAKNGIALMEVVNGAAMFIQASAASARELPSIPDKLAALVWPEDPEGFMALPMAISKKRIFVLEHYLEDGWAQNKAIHPTPAHSCLRK